MDKTDCNKITLAAAQGDEANHRAGVSPWRLFDSKFKQHYISYVMQCTLATLLIIAVLLMLDTMTQTVLISSLGASTFISFTMPHTRSSGPRYLVGGYLIGTLAGVLISHLGTGMLLEDLSPGCAQIILAAIATGLAIFCMVITNTEHPPAAALAMGYVLNAWTPMTIVVVLCGILLVSTSKELIKKYMIDLL